MTEKSELKIDVINVLQKQLGVKTGVEMPVRTFVSSGNLALDWAISGSFLGKGLPVGRVVEFFGEPSTGKSLLIMQILANTQKQGGIAIWDDVEQAYDAFFAQRVGIDISKLILLDSETVEEHFERIEEIVQKIREQDKDVLITVALDSLAMLSTRHEKESGFSKVDLSKAKLIRQGMRKVGAAFNKQGVLYCVANHVISNIGVVYGPKTSTPGGGGVPFQSSVRIELDVRSKIVEKGVGGGNSVTGVLVRARVVKNKISPPFKETMFSISFTDGVNRLSGIVPVLLEMGKIVLKSPGWYLYKEKSYREVELPVEEILQDCVLSEKVRIDE